jgi:hypothetical protein
VKCGCAYTEKAKTLTKAGIAFGNLMKNFVTFEIAFEKGAMNLLLQEQLYPHE